jgi:hypothetical protein
MSIGMAMLSAFILVCACSLFAGLIYGLIWILIDHPVVLGAALFWLLWAGVTWTLTLLR